MPFSHYTLKPAANPPTLAEEEVLYTDKLAGVWFTSFDSCIGIVGRFGSMMIAAHLVILGDHDTPPDAASIGMAFAGATDITLFGDIGTWKDNNLLAPVTEALGSIREKDGFRGQFHVYWDVSARDWSIQHYE